MSSYGTDKKPTKLGKRVYFRLIASLLFLYLLQLNPVNAARYASIIMDEAESTVLHAVNPDLQIFPASLTKMMTLYLVFENLESGNLHRKTLLNVSRKAAQRPKSKLGVKRNAKITVDQCIKALVTKSANDIATVLAEAIGGTEENFAQMMTNRARQLKMSRTQFKNASGLPHKNQVSTARDMALLSIALRKNFPSYFTIFKTRQFYYRGNNYKNHNKLLKRLKGTDGIKTGYIRDSGYNIAVSLKYKKRRLIGTFFGGKTAKRRDRHVIKVFKQVFEMLDQMDIIDQRNNTTFAQNDNSFISRSKPNRSQTSIKSIKNKIKKVKRGYFWSVQVGAFYQFRTAHMAAMHASKAMRNIQHTRIYIKENFNRGRRIYRARLIGMQRFKAKQVCLRLKQRKIPCLVVRETSTVSQGNH